jgi:hypothetical protein
MAISAGKVSLLIDIEERGGAAAIKLMRQTESAMTAAARAGETSAQLGIRSEETLRGKIVATKDAYDKLNGSVTATANDKARAFVAMQNQLKALNAELAVTSHKLETVDNKTRAINGLKVAAGAVTATAASAAVLARPAITAMNYDDRLADMANTAFADRDLGGRKTGMKELEGAILKSVSKGGGGTREQAAEALDAVIASGVIEAKDAIAMLPDLTKSATASGASAAELAMIVVRAKQTFKISTAEALDTMNTALVGGQMGGFELKNMAKWLPQQMAMGKNLGLSGKADYAKLVAWNQASVITSGTKDEAGNNLRDLLNELNTPHFRNYMATEYLANGQKAKKGEKGKRLNTIDDVFLKYRSEGVDKVSATVDMMGAIFEKDPKYKALQKQLNGLDKNDTSGRQAVLESMTAQVQGTNVGKIFHNQQSLMAMMALMNNADYVTKVTKGASDAGSNGAKELNLNYATKEDQAFFKVQQAKEMKAAAEKNVMDNMTPTIGRVAEGFGDLASKFPMLVGSTTLATTALLAFAGVAGLAALTIAKTGGGLPGALTTPTGAATGVGGRFMGLLKGSAVVAGLLGLVQGAGVVMDDKNETKGRDLSRIGVTTGAGVLGGAAAGALVGSIVPVVGTVLGGLIGGGLGMWGGGAAFDAMWKPGAPVEKPPIQYPPGTLSPEQSYRSYFESPKYQALSEKGLLSVAGGAGAAVQPDLFKPKKFELGEGKLVVDLRLPEGYSASTSAFNLPNIKLDSGSTAPWARN